MPKNHVIKSSTLQTLGHNLIGGLPAANVKNDLQLQESKANSLPLSWDQPGNEFQESQRLKGVGKMYEIKTKKAVDEWKWDESRAGVERV